ncbi:MAG: YeeE/YedE family protein [Gemmatimonadaceae bacterium]|nr:YeeE/YedE family protein [Gemmatimonadaceae bacterium]MCW5827434.1 YeeE/YedE family protein [Gemmatimonadaceae bacterium]
MLQNLFGLLVGIAMGVLIQRVRASSPAVILQNLRLENIGVIKFMATTIAVGMIVVYTLNLFIPNLLHFEIRPTYLVGVFLGGLIFGVGFGLGGYCPGTCVVGIGEGRRDAWFALLGGIVGALVFTLVYTVAIAPVIAVLDFGRITVQDVLHLPAIVAALGVGALFLIVVKLLPTQVKRA